MLADLHLHSCFSDGTRTPEEIAAVIKANGIGLAALADHNSCAGYSRFKSACDASGITAIRGIELDCVFEGKVIHILGYSFEPVGRIMMLADHSKRLLLEMSRDLIKKMSADYPQLSLSEYDAWEYDPSGGGWKGLHYLLQKQVIETLTHGMSLYGRYDCDYSSYPFPSATAVCEAIRDASGIPVLAHPANWWADCLPEELFAHFDGLRSAGIGGIECYYPSHTPQMTARCLLYCNRNNLLVTVGSDCHGNFNRQVAGVEYSIGVMKVDTSQLNLGRLWQSGISQK